MSEIGWKQGVLDRVRAIMKACQEIETELTRDVGRYAPDVTVSVVDTPVAPPQPSVLHPEKRRRRKLLPLPALDALVPPPPKCLTPGCTLPIFMNGAGGFQCAAGHVEALGGVPSVPSVPSVPAGVTMLTPQDFGAPPPVTLEGALKASVDATAPLPPVVDAALSEAMSESTGRPHVVAVEPSFPFSPRASVLDTLTKAELDALNKATAESMRAGVPLQPPAKPYGPELRGAMPFEPLPALKHVGPGDMHALTIPEPGFHPPPRAATNTSNIPNALSQLAGDLRTQGVVVDLTELATWGDTKWDVARAWLDQGAKPDDRPEFLPSAPSQNRAELVARAYDEGLLTDDTLDVDEAWIQLQYRAPKGWFGPPPMPESSTPPSEPPPERTRRGRGPAPKPTEPSPPPPSAEDDQLEMWMRL